MEEIYVIDNGKIKDKRRPAHLNREYKNLEEACVQMNTMQHAINKLIDIIIEKNKHISKLEHELDSCHGLYAADNKDFKDSFKLDFSEVLKNRDNYLGGSDYLGNNL